MNIQKTTSQKLPRREISAQQGVVLLEALVAILIFSMGVLALVGLQAAMIKNTSDAKYRSEASFIAQQWIGVMWSNPDNTVAYVIPDNTDPRFDISSRLPSGTRTVTQSVADPNQFVITITWTQPGQPQHNFTTIASIAGG